MPLSLRALLTASLSALVLVQHTSGHAAPAAPLPTPTPAPPSVAGPPDGLIAPPPPVTTRPLPAPQPFPTPAPAPTRPPIVRPAQPEQSASAAPRVPAPRPAPSAAAPVEAAPVPVPQTAPATPPPLPQASAPPPVASDEPTAPPTAPPAPSDGDGGVLLPLALGVLGLGALGYFVWRRRRAPLALPAPEVEASSTPPKPKPMPKAAPVAAAPPPAPAPTSTPLGRRADLAVAFEALSAQSTLLNLRIRYAVTVRNEGTIPAAPVRLRIGLFAGSHARPEGIAQWFARADEVPHHGIESIPAGGQYRFEGELAAPLDALNPITVDGRVLAIPLVAVDARYNHPGGEAPIDGQSARAFVIGRDSGREGAKLAPFRLDQGPTSFAPLGQRDTGISRVA